MKFYFSPRRRRSPRLATPAAGAAGARYLTRQLSAISKREALPKEPQCAMRGEMTRKWRDSIVFLSMVLLLQIKPATKSSTLQLVMTDEISLSQMILCDNEPPVYILPTWQRCK